MTLRQAYDTAVAGIRVRREPWVGTWVEFQRYFFWLVTVDPRTFVEISRRVVRADDMASADHAATDWTTDPWPVPDIPTADGIAWPVRCYQTGGIGATAAFNYCGIHYERGPLATFLSSLDDPVTVTSDGVRPANGHGSIEIIAYDQLGKPVWSGITSNGTFQPDNTVTAPYSGFPSELLIDPSQFAVDYPCAAFPSPPWCGCNWPLDLTLAG